MRQVHHAPPTALRHRLKFNKRSVVPVIAGTVLVGIMVIIAVFAAGKSQIVEVEDGTASNGARITQLTGASGGKGAVFASRTVSPGASPAASTSPGPGSGLAADPSDCAQTAAAKLGWGTATYQSDFNNGATLDPTWHPYGPESGHNGAGMRLPSAITQGNGNVTISADGNGNTGAMKWFPGQRYGRWEVCMKVATGKQHYVLIGWPDAEDFPVGGEIDFAEESGGTGNQSWFLHYGAGNNQTSGSTSHDASQWTAWAVEWTPTKMTAYVNGEVWHTETNSGIFPPRPMNLCMQLDYFGKSGADSMTIDWTKQWSIPETQPSTLGLAPGDLATGHPNENPAKAPRPLTINQMLGR